MNHFSIYPVKQSKKFGSSLPGFLLIKLSSIPIQNSVNWEALLHLPHTTDFFLHTDFTISTSFFFESPKHFVSKFLQPLLPTLFHTQQSKSSNLISKCLQFSSSLTLITSYPSHPYTV